MMKFRTVYRCQECAHAHRKWTGKCESCGAWNSLQEDVEAYGKKEPSFQVQEDFLPAQNLEDIEVSEAQEARISSGFQDLDLVLGGGFMPGSMSLVSGEPGIGKSTLLLQIVSHLSQNLEKVLYISGEESIHQIAHRAKRLQANAKKLKLLYENRLEAVIQSLEKEKPSFFIIDSIQVLQSEALESSAGSIAQVRLCAEKLISWAKRNACACILIGHVNKDGNLAGPKVLEHLVDSVFLLEGERDANLRLVRALKNRYGAVNEIALFQMEQEGMKEYSHYSQELLDSRKDSKTGSILSISFEGNRPFLVEIQALVTQSFFGYPKRSAQGMDKNRLEMILAILEKHYQTSFSDQDVYVNVMGGMRIKDPACDLALAQALVSSKRKKAIPQDWVATGELSLTGEIRHTSSAKEREKFCQKLGLQHRKTLESDKA